MQRVAATGVVHTDGIEAIASVAGLQIRKEVIEALDQIMSYEWFNLDSTFTRVRFIKDRLSLLWGE